MVREQIRLRSRFIPCLDVLKMLKEATARRRLILTLPWVVEFCSVLDPVIIRLTYFKRLFTLMVPIHRTLRPKKDTGELKRSGSVSSDLEDLS